MKKLTIMMITVVALLLIGCGQAPNNQPGPLKASDTSLYGTPSNAAVGAAITNPLPYNDKIFVQNTNGSENRTISVYGFNYTNVTFNETFAFGNVSGAPNISTNSYYYVLRLKLNASANGNVTVYANNSRNIIAFIPQGTVDSYVAVRPDYTITSPDYVPALCQNTSAFNVKPFTYIDTYVACGQGNFTITPYTSPGYGIWYNQSAIACANSKTLQALSDITPQQMMYQICNNDGNSTNLLVEIVGK